MTTLLLSGVSKNKQIMLEQLIVKKPLLSVLVILALFAQNIHCVMGSSEKLVALNFEVFGVVQGVFFRKYTQQQASKLGLRGWCMNTERNTVQGVIEGNPSTVAAMKDWLQKTGSPKSKIDKAVFTNEHDIAKYSFDKFTIKR